MYGFVPVRKLEMSAPYMRSTPEKPYVLLHTRIYPMEATDRKLLWSITDASGIPSPVAKLEELEDGESIRITGVSDGSFQVTELDDYRYCGRRIPGFCFVDSRRYLLCETGESVYEEKD